MYVTEISILYDKYACDLLGMFDEVLCVCFIRLLLYSDCDILDILHWYMVAFGIVAWSTDYFPMGANGMGLGGPNYYGKNQTASPQFFYPVPFFIRQPLSAQHLESSSSVGHLAI
jgi:hypothetical protein